MDFLIDAQLPQRLARWLTEQGHPSRHTLDLPQKNATPDAEICRICGGEKRVLVTKDADFANSFFLKGDPAGLVLVSTGNITNNDLFILFQEHLGAIVSAFDTCSFIELEREGMTVHS
jgi:predicted nuclease of predicted toxin-antitoxin system